MKLHNLFNALILATLALSSSAFAIDQVILKNGQIVEGKILSDVPNRHVDIQLVNGNKRRYQQTDVSSVERDVPSNTDSRMAGNNSEFFIAPQLGVDFGLKTGSTPDFLWGARFGVNASQMGDFAKLAFALNFLHTQTSQTIGTTVVTGSANIILAQTLFRKVGNSGFYFGPQFGLTLGSITFTGTTANITGTAFTFGTTVGYDYYVNDGFSFGPDVQWIHVGGTTFTASTGGSSETTSSDSIAALLNLTFHL